MLLEWVVKHRINEYSDLLGLLITIVGFGFTIFGVWRSKKIAKEALIVAKKVRDDLRKIEIVAEFSTAIVSMEEIKRLHRKADFQSLPERYSSLRRSLITIRSEVSALSDEDSSLIQNAISNFAGFERKIEKYIAKGQEAKVDFVKMNQIVSLTIDQVHEVLVKIKLEIGDGK